MLARLLLVVLTCAAVTAMADDIRFVAGTSDVPLMPGLTQDSAAALVWDKPEGRIVEAEAYGDVTADAVTAFYRLSLGQLGWVPTADNLVFVREGEKLTITADRAQGRTGVHFGLELK